MVTDSWSNSSSLYLYGLCGLFTMLLILGFMGLVPEAHRREGSIATGSIMLCWALTYQLTVGTVAYSLVAEMSTRRLQIKTVSLTLSWEDVLLAHTNP